MTPREILEASTVTGLSLVLPADLGRPDYVAVNKVLDALGGKWNRRAKAHLFDDDPAEAIAAYIRGGAAPLPARTAEGFVPTPADLAWQLVHDFTDLEDVDGEVTVLEPSAGDGALVAAILAANQAADVTAVEPNARRASKIAGADLFTTTFEEFAAQTSQRFDYVVMNPPFAVPGQASIWIDHVRLGYGLLNPGGRLVAIVPAGFKQNADRRHTAIRDLVDEHGGWAQLPDDAFGGIRTVALHLDRPAEVTRVDDLHHPDGSHVGTARTANGRDLEQHETRIHAHLAEHAAQPAPAAPEPDPVSYRQASLFDTAGV